MSQTTISFCGNSNVNVNVWTLYYDLNGHVQRVQFTNGNVNEYVYGADGRKLRATYRTAIPGIVVPTGDRHTLTDSELDEEITVRYVDGFEVVDNWDCANYFFGNGYLDCDTRQHYNFHFFAKDHLGSTRAVFHSDGTLENVYDYQTYGNDMCDWDNRLESMTHKYNGKELETRNGLNLYDYGARLYDPVTGLFTSIDPLCEKYYHISPYAYCMGNPVKYVDPDGREVKAVFNKETNKLYILDLDYYNKALPTVWVSAKKYQLGGIRDKGGNLTHNQVLVVNNVFSGGRVESGKLVRDADDSRQLAIPNAKYDIVDNNADTRHTGWFRLDRQDNSRYNDKDNVAGRDGYRFHLGGLSWGCVTVDKTQDNAQASWDVISSIFNSTSTTTVSEKRGKQWLNPFSKLTRYGTLEVKGTDKIPFKHKEER